MLVLSFPGGRFPLRPAFFPSLLTLLLLALLPGPGRPISFHLPGKARKCLREEIHRDMLVTGEYEVAPPPGSSSGPSANLKITDSAGHILYSKEDATKGKFAFTTEDYDTFEACFESKLPVGECERCSRHLFPFPLYQVDLKGQHWVRSKGCCYAKYFESEREHLKMRESFPKITNDGQLLHSFTELLVLEQW